MPRVRRKVATLDSRFVQLTSFRGGTFDLALRLGSGLPKLIIPLNWTAHANRLRAQGFELGTTIRLGLDGDRVWVELIFERKRPHLRTEGRVLGMDRGLNKAFSSSDGQVIGADLKAEIKAQDKRAKTAHHYIKTELFRRLKQLKLEGVKTIVLEDLRNIKRGKRGKFPRRLNRLLSFWLTARAMEWLECRCEELGIRVMFVSPSKTSQRCSHCGKIDSRSRRGERFKCVHCGYETDADYNASRNLEALGLAGVYSLRFLPTS
jgi:IS605 OrfB family transposase